MASFSLRWPNYVGVDAKGIIQMCCKECSQVKSYERRKDNWKLVNGRWVRSLRIPCNLFAYIKFFLHWLRQSAPGRVSFTPKWRRHVPLKRRCQTTYLHGVKKQKKRYLTNNQGEIKKSSDNLPPSEILQRLCIYKTNVISNQLPICMHTSEHYLASVSHLFVIQPEILILTLVLIRTIHTRRQRSQKVTHLIAKKCIQTGPVISCWNTGIFGKAELH